MKLFYTLLFVALAVIRTGAYGPQSKVQKRESRFFDCILAIEAADADQDDRLSKQETAKFFATFYQNLLADKASAIVTPYTGDMSTDVEKMYAGLVGLSDPPQGVTEIDVYGANVMDLPMVDESRLNALRGICEAVSHGFLANFLFEEKSRCKAQWGTSGLDPDAVLPSLIARHTVISPYKICDYYFYQKAEEELFHGAQ